MRIMALRSKARDVRLLAVGFLALYLLVDSRWDASPLASSAMLASGTLLAGMAVILRAWATLYIAGRKTEQLVVEGPFSVCRNPIYLSTLLGLLGVTLDTCTLTLPVLAILLFVPYFRVQVRGEERRLLARHGARFEAYCRRTPRLLPDFSRLSEPREFAVHPAEFRRWMADGLWFVWGIGLVELIDALHDAAVLPVLRWVW